jgi:hypothetical protein
VRLLSLTIALLHVGAVLAPCPGDWLGDLVVSEQAAAPMNGPMTRPHAHHGHRGARDSQRAAAHRSHGDPEPPPIIKARCGCGCGSAPAAATAPNARIGYALSPAMPRLAAFEGVTEVAIQPASLPSTPLASIDHVPIPS